MGQNSAIEWTDHTFNPWWGCAKVSPACAHCYAEAFAKRTGNNVWGIEAPRRLFGEAHWREPVKWNAAAAKAGRPARVFCASMADVFEDRPDVEDARGRLYGLIEATPMLDWLLLTKRPGNIRAMLPADWLRHPPRNIRLGTTAENQEWANRRLEALVSACPDTSLFVSAEPLLGPIDFEPWAKRLDWIIVGGESGAQARPIQAAWVRQIRDFCQRNGQWFFFKQWGGRTPKANGKELDGREWCEVPTISQG